MRKTELPIAILTTLVLAGASLANDLPAPDEFPARIEGRFASAIVIDAATGLVLVETDADVRRPPASMLKMMTELLVLERIEEGDLSLGEEVTVSAKSSRMGGSQVYLKHNEVFTVTELLKALAIHSANDAAVALAEHVAGSTDAFVDLMNIRARELGMTGTEFHTVHGLPPGWKQQSDLTTARDMAVLGRELVRHPLALEWASTETAPFRDGEFTLYNPNKLVGKYRGLDGIKTGYTGAAGFCVTASAIQKGRRLISVVMGCPSDRDRANETTRLLSFAFNMYKQVAVFSSAGEPLPEPVPVRGGKQGEVAVTYAESIEISVPRNREQDLEMRVELDEGLTAPLEAGEPAGRAVVSLDGVDLAAVPIVTVDAVEKGNWFHRLLNK